MPITVTPTAAGLQPASAAQSVTTMAPGDQIAQHNTYKATALINTTIAAGSDGIALPQSAIFVVSTMGAPITGGVMWIDALQARIAYTSITGGATPTFNGCTTTSTGTMALGMVVSDGDPQLTLYRLACLIQVACSALLGVAYLAASNVFTALNIFNAGIEVNADTELNNTTTCTAPTNTNVLVVNALGGGDGIEVVNQVGANGRSLFANNSPTGTASPTAVIQQDGLSGGLVVTGTDASNTQPLVSLSNAGGGDVLAVQAASYLDTAIDVKRGVIVFSGTQPAANDAVPANSASAPQVCKAWGTFEILASGGGVSILDGVNINDGVAFAPSVTAGRNSGVNTALLVFFATALADQGSNNNWFASSVTIVSGGPLTGAPFVPYVAFQSKSQIGIGVWTGSADLDLATITGPLTVSVTIFGRD